METYNLAKPTLSDTKPTLSDTKPTLSDTSARKDFGVFMKLPGIVLKIVVLVCGKSILFADSISECIRVGQIIHILLDGK
jgi:hypothetical protein